MAPGSSSKGAIPRHAARWLAFGPYYGMFPVQFALDAIREYTRPGDSLLDPFTGRGTSVAAAWALGRQGCGVEINPVAWLYSRVKVSPASERDVLRRLEEICDASDAYDGNAENMPEFYMWCFAPHARRFLLAARKMLKWESSRVDRTLAAFILAYLHGKWGSALSNQMRQQKSMAPAYSVRWWQAREMRPPDVDPRAFLAQRIRWRYAWGTMRGACADVLLGDAREALLDTDSCGRPRARLLLTSPPYYGLTSYYYDHWLRYWVLGGPEAPTRSGERWRSESRQDNRQRYADLLMSVFRGSANLLAADATVYVRTDRREFTCQATVDALRVAFPRHDMQLIEAPYRRSTQTALFGDKEMKPGEVDLILTRGLRRRSKSRPPAAAG